MAPGENAESSLRDDLAKGLADIEAREAAAQPNEEEAPTGEAEAKPETTEAKAERNDGRDAHGRFVSKSNSPEGEAASQEKGQAPADSQPSSEADNKPTDQTQTPVSAEADAPPKSLTAEEAAAWKDFSPLAKAAFIRRDKDAAKLAGANDAERMFGREMADLFRPHVQEIQAAGATPQLALKTLLANHNALRSNDMQVKYTKAAELLRSYGVDPAQLAGVQLPDQNISALQSKIAELEQRLSNPQGQQFAPLPPSADEVNIATEIERFRADPAHPHFDAVREQMGGLLQAGLAPDLEAAYQMAVAAVPALRSTPTTPVAAANPQEKTAAARSAAVSVTGSPGKTGNPVPGTLRDDLIETARSLGFSV